MSTDDQIKDLFERFKALHPGNNEAFDPTLDNLRRWNWAIREADRRNSVEYEKFGDIDPNLVASAQALAESRASRTFGRLPQYIRTKFEELASFFPGRDVYATGSRVTGEYVDPTSGAKIRRMRQVLRKKEVVESDYDIIVDPLPKGKIADIRKGLPPRADLVINPLPDEPKILIPMWDFSKLPEDKHAEVIDLFERRSWGQLMAIHNEHQLSREFYCCETDAVRRWFTWGIENGHIKKPNEDKKEQG